MFEQHHQGRTTCLPKRTTQPWWLSALLLIFVQVLSSHAEAQGVELSRSDRLAILYTPQLTFAASGEPLIKIGIVEGVQSIQFSADTAITIMPLGEGGSRIHVPAGADLRMEISDGQAGEYRYSVVVAELVPSERSSIGELRELWRSRGYEPRSVEVGAIFAVAGQRFDTRKTLLTLGETMVRREASRLATTITDTYNVEARVHAELDSYPGGTLTLTGLAGGVTVTHRDLMWVRGEPQTVFTVRDVPFDVGTHHEGRETRRYVGSLIFTTDREGQLAMVNETTIERLLRGIVPAEIYASSPEQSLRAQSIAARSELLTDLGARHLAEPYMTCADQRCQVYRGVDYEHANTNAAIEATRGEVLADGDQIIKAYFSANNGGFAGSNHHTWGEPERPYLRPRLDAASPPAEWVGGLVDEDAVRAFLANPPDAYANITSFGSGRNFRWTHEMSGSEVTQAVSQRYEGLGTITDLEVVARDPSGRITQLRVVGTDGSALVERELNIRRTLGGLRSALFVFERIERSSSGAISRVVLSGGGHGHGVGMCQSGAIGAAERGLTYEEILQNYYPGTTLRRLY